MDRLAGLHPTLTAEESGRAGPVRAESRNETLTPPSCSLTLGREHKEYDKLRR
jgi:hypothetical protein